VGSLCFTHDGARLISIANDDNHVLRIWDWRAQRILSEHRGDTNKILGIACSPIEAVFCTVGIRHVKFWSYQTDGFYGARKGVFGKAGRMCNQTTVQYLDNGDVITGGTNGFLYIWRGNTCVKSALVHRENSAIHALCVGGEFVYSGGADRKLVTLTKDLFIKESMDMSAIPRAIDTY
jgi:WD40 repeat protein